MNKNYDETIYPCFSKMKAIKLRERGFQIIKTEVNRRFPKYDVFYFENTEELKKALEEIKIESEVWKTNQNLNK